MLPETILDQSPVWLLYVGTVLLALRRQRGRIPPRHACAGRTCRKAEKAPASAIMGSTLGLLAFMLAFTFGMSGSRFDARKQLVLDEASAVLRAHQRAQFLPEPQRSECSRLLRDYVELRLRVASRHSVSEMQELVTRSEGGSGRPVEGDRDARGSTRARACPSSSSRFPS